MSAAAIARARPGALFWAGVLMLASLVVLLGMHVAGVALDFVSALRDPLEIDYGEGIVWQQALLIPGPRMYGTGTGLPFIVFHYPPVYHLLTRAMASLVPDMLQAGRLVSELSTVAIGPLVVALVMVASPSAGGRVRGMAVLVAVAAGLLALSLHAVRTWGMAMRVDMVSIMLGLAGLLVAARADGRWLGTTIGLLLCVGAVYTKQTQLSAGIAVFVVALLRRPRSALLAGALAGAVAVAALALLQVATGGGFLLNIVGYNINRYSLRHAYWAIEPEISSLPFMAMMMVAAVWTLLRLWRAAGGGGGLPAAWQGVRTVDRAGAARGMLLLQFALASLMLVTIFKSGGNFNYFLEWLCLGCVLLGVWLRDLLAGGRLSFVVATGVLAGGVATLPYRNMPDRIAPAILAQNAALVERVRAAAGPVGSENMTVLMQAGKAVVYEPSIVTELAEVGRWDEAPLLAMIRQRQFAFMITTDNTSRSTQAVAAAIREMYPRMETVGHRLFINLPPSNS